MAWLGWRAEHRIRLRLAMRYHRVTVIELSRASGVTPGMIRHMLNGTRVGSTDTQAALAEALDEDPGWVFPRNENESIRAEMYRLGRSRALGTTQKRPGLEVAHAFIGECESVAGL